MYLSVPFIYSKYGLTGTKRLSPNVVNIVTQSILGAGFLLHNILIDSFRHYLC